MQVETYEQKELLASRLGMVTDDGDREAYLALVDKLGLKGQQGLIAEPGEVLAYPELTLEQQRILEIVCPTRTPLDKYGAATIPMRVLEVADAQQANFKRLEVWHPTSARDPDPALIGTRKHPDRTWSEQWFLLARWGDVLLSWDELREVAQVRLRALWRSTAERRQHEAQAALAAMDANVEAYLRGLAEQPGILGASLA